MLLPALFLYCPDGVNGCVAQGAQHTGLLPRTICTLGVTSSWGQEWCVEVKEWQSAQVSAFLG